MTVVMTDAMTDAIKSSGRNKSGKTNGIFAKTIAGRNTGIRGAAPAQGMTCARADAFPENIEVANMSSTTGVATALAHRHVVTTGCEPVATLYSSAATAA